MPRPTTALFALASMLVLSAPSFAQGTHPDFSGLWILDRAKSEAPALPPAAQLFVSQSDKLLSVEHTVSSSAGAAQTNRLVYHIDGSAAKNTTPVGNGASVEFNTTSEWNGKTLVLTTTSDFSGGLKQIERWTLSADGKQLTVLGDITLSGKTATAKMFYDKKS